MNAIRPQTFPKLSPITTNRPQTPRSGSKLITTCRIHRKSSQIALHVPNSSQIRLSSLWIISKSSQIALFVSKSFQIHLSILRIVFESSQIMLTPSLLVSRCQIDAIECQNRIENTHHESKGILSSCPFHSVGAVNSYNNLTPRCLVLR